MGINVWRLGLFQPPLTEATSFLQNVLKQWPGVLYIRDTAYVSLRVTCNDPLGTNEQRLEHLRVLTSHFIWASAGSQPQRWEQPPLQPPGPARDSCSTLGRSGPPASQPTAAARLVFQESNFLSVWCQRGSGYVCIQQSPSFFHSGPSNSADRWAPSFCPSS